MKNKIKQLFYNKAPNALRFEHVKFHFPDENDEKLRDALNELIRENFLRESPEHPHPEYPSIPLKATYSIRPEHFGKYPIETEIDIDGFKIPRMFDNVSVVVAEDMNTVYEQFSKITNQKIEKLKKANQNQLKEFWGSLITIFGIFVTVFSLININVRPIYYSNELHLTGKELLAQSACNVAPLAVVLGVFLVALFFIFRK